MKLSIVIPTLNEEEIIEKNLMRLSRIPGIDQIIIADGGSTDDTLYLASHFNTKIVYCPSGRGVQMDLGWRHTDADLICFHHADTLFPKNGAKLIKDAFESDKVALTCFKLNFSNPARRFRLIAFGANLRTRFFKYPYGDQSIAVRRCDLLEINGLPHLKYLEDVDLVNKVKKFGRVKILKSEVYASVRKYSTKGVWRTVFKKFFIKSWYNITGKPPWGFKI